MLPKPQTNSTAQSFLDIYDITNNFTILKTGVVSVVLTVSAMNFGLLAEAEQDAVIYTYAALLNSLNYPIQILIQSQTKDVTDYLNLLKEQESAASSDKKRERIARYRQFVFDLIKERNVLDKKFFVVVSATPNELGLLSADSVIPGKTTFDITQFEKSVILEKVEAILDPRRDHLINQFARIGLFARQLSTQEIIRIFYTNYNPEASEGQELTDTNQYTTPLVRANFIKQSEEILTSQQIMQQNQPQAQQQNIQQQQQQSPQPVNDQASSQTHNQGVTEPTSQQDFVVQETQNDTKEVSQPEPSSLSQPEPSSQAEPVSPIEQASISTVTPPTEPSQVFPSSDNTNMLTNDPTLSTNAPPTTAVQTNNFQESLDDFESLAPTTVTTQDQELNSSPTSSPESPPTLEPSIESPPSPNNTPLAQAEPLLQKVSQQETAQEAADLQKAINQALQEVGEGEVQQQNPESTTVGQKPLLFQPTQIIQEVTPVTITADENLQTSSTEPIELKKSEEQLVVLTTSADQTATIPSTQTIEPPAVQNSTQEIAQDVVQAQSDPLPPIAEIK